MKKCVVRRVNFISKDTTLPKFNNPYYLRATPKTTWVTPEQAQQISIESNVDWKVNH